MSFMSSARWPKMQGQFSRNCSPVLCAFLCRTIFRDCIREGHGNGSPGNKDYRSKHIALGNTSLYMLRNREIQNEQRSCFYLKTQVLTIGASIYVLLDTSTR